MRIFSIALGAALLATAIPTIAQTAPADSPDAPHTPLPYDRGYDKDSPRTDAINAVEGPRAAAANDQVNAQYQAQAATADTQYARDLADYRTAVRQRHREIALNEATAQRQERAYAEAMADWRRQVEACRHDNRRVCEQPAPDPANYM